MSNTYPEIINFEINRTQLEQYMNRVGLYLISFVFIILGGYISFSHTINSTIKLKFKSKEEMYYFMIGRMCICVALTVLVIYLFYILGVCRHSRRYVSTLKVSVEGSFLRIQEYSGNLVDRKIHFRSIVDYSTIQSPMMTRYGIQTLKMNTTTGGQNSSITIHGIEDCLKVRDILSSIDQQREKF